MLLVTISLYLADNVFSDRILPDRGDLPDRGVPGVVGQRAAHAAARAAAHAHAAPAHAWTWSVLFENSSSSKENVTGEEM